jgi:drug/metabolite transporter (DMT)-like permease
MWLCAAAMVTVGSTVVASKVIAAGLPPFTATALRFALALPVFALLMRLTRTPWPRPGRSDLYLLLCQAGLGSVGYTVLLIMGVRLAPAASAGVVAGTLPAVAALVAVVALRERPGRYLVGSIALATAGVLAISWPRASGAGDPASPAVLAGNLLVLGAVGCEAAFILLNKRLRVQVRPLALSALMTAFGLALALIPALLERAWAEPLAPAALGGVAYYALVPTVLGFVLWFAGASRLTGAEAALFTAILPVSALVLAAVWLGESIGLAQIGGAACVLGAVGLASLDSRRAKRPGTPKNVLGL